MRHQQLSTEIDPPPWTLGIEKECEAAQEVPAEAARKRVSEATLAPGQAKSTKSASTNSSEKEALIGQEEQAWEAWKTRDGKFFESFLSEESIGVGDSRVAKKAMIVKDIAGPDCEVRSYSFDNYEVVMLDANTAILTYKADQDATCKGKAVPARVWASSVYVKRGGKWLNAFHQEIPVTPE